MKLSLEVAEVLPSNLSHVFKFLNVTLEKYQKSSYRFIPTEISSVILAANESHDIFSHFITYCRWPSYAYMRLYSPEFPGQHNTYLLHPDPRCKMHFYSCLSQLNPERQCEAPVHCYFH